MEVKQDEEIRNLIYILQCRYCLFCTNKQCRLDDNFGKCETKLVDECNQKTVAGEDT